MLTGGHHAEERLIELVAMAVDYSKEINPEVVASISGVRTPSTHIDGIDAIDDAVSPALSKSDIHVLRAMASFDTSRLLSATTIIEAVDIEDRLSEETVRLCVLKLMRDQLATRPEGKRNGARLTIHGRRLAGKIAD